MIATASPTLRSRYGKMPPAALLEADDAVAHFADQHIDQQQADDLWLEILQDEVLIGGLLDRLTPIDGIHVNRGPGASLGSSAVFVQRDTDLAQIGATDNPTRSQCPASDTYLEIAPFFGVVFEWYEVDSDGQQQRVAFGTARDGDSATSIQPWFDNPTLLEAVLGSMERLTVAFLSGNIDAVVALDDLSVTAGTDASL